MLNQKSALCGLYLRVDRAAGPPGCSSGLCKLALRSSSEGVQCLVNRPPGTKYAMHKDKMGFNLPCLNTPGAGDVAAEDLNWSVPFLW